MTSNASHRLRMSRPVLAVIIIWAVLWIIGIATWMYDVNGYTVGMPPVVFNLTLLGPLLVGLVLGWGKETLWKGVRAGMAGGVLFGLANMVGQLVWGLILRLFGRIPPDAMTEMGGMAFFAIEIVEFTLLFALTGFILGLIGGSAGQLLSRVGRPER